MTKKNPDDVSIGKFDILATYAYAKALLDGLAEDEAKERGMVAAIMGAKAKLGHGGGTQDDHEAGKDAAEKKKKTTITAESFDHQVADKMGGFFEKTFLPTMKKLVKAGPLVRRGEAAREDPDDLGGEDQRASSSRSGRRRPHDPRPEAPAPTIRSSSSISGTWPALTFRLASSRPKNAARSISGNSTRRPDRRRPLDREGVAGDRRRVAVPLEGPGVDDLAPLLLHRAQGEEGAGRGGADLLLELPDGGVEGLLARPDLALGDRPGPLVLVAEERPAGVDEEDLQAVRRPGGTSASRHSS